MAKGAKSNGRSGSTRPKARVAAQRSDDANAFIPDPGDGPAKIDDDLAENLAEEFLETATRGDGGDDASIDGIVSEEIGGPFVETTAAEEFAGGTDDANPPDAEPEPLPRATAGLVQQPPPVDDE
jgi:hypothetical protein